MGLLFSGLKQGSQKAARKGSQFARGEGSQKAATSQKAARRPRVSFVACAVTIPQFASRAGPCARTRRGGGGAVGVDFALVLVSAYWP